ncbi:MAG: 7TM diverse intracellular signaling domain-containing protein [Ferruginibacter sp.]
MKKTAALIRFAIIGFLLFFTCCASAQAPVDSNSIDISMISESLDISKMCAVYVDSNGMSKENPLQVDAWKPLSSINTDKYIPNAWITKPIYLKFTLENNSDTAKIVYFIAGTYVRSMYVFKWIPDQPSIQLKDESRGDGYQPVELKPKEKQVFIVRCNYTKRNFNYISPVLINDDYLRKYKNLKYYRNDAQPAVGYLLGGILLMMIFFTGANYFQSKKKEFLYNCCYSICMFGLVFLNTFLDRKSGILSSLFNEYLDFMLLATGTIFYIAFTRKFLDTKANYPLLNKIFVTTEKLVIIILACFTFIVFFTDNFQLQKAIENGMKVLALIIGIIYIVIALAQKNKLMNYLAIGNAMLILFSIISFYMILFQHRNNSIFTNSMVYYEIGIVSELIFFLSGLVYKIRIELIEKTQEQESLKLEAEKLSYESKLAVLNAQQKERNRISADMHDDLGAGVTAIRLYSELAKKRIGKEVIPEIEKISSSANELLNNMNAIIWTMSSSNDSLDNMVAYIRGYALEYFENTGINCHIQLEENIPNIAVSGEIRRNVYLVVKEALNNILKHSRATDVSINLKREADGLSLYIHDNGKGIDFNNLRRFGNGLINMKKRMEETNMLLTIENKNGTLITLHSKFPH